MSELNYANSVENPVQAPSVTKELSENVILTCVDDLYDWARLSTLYPMMFGTACCFMEFMAAYGPRFDLERFGAAPRATPRQADLMITAGTITLKYAPALVRLYEQIPEPKYVIAMGACTITGGMFSADSPSAVRGVDKLIPVDVYIPGCPPRPEAVIDGIIKLRKKMAVESWQERNAPAQTHRFHTVGHRMKEVEPVLTGDYVRSHNPLPVKISEELLPSLQSQPNRAE
jgi:NAD(P)H-quinone oxidoreductase subunit K